MKVLLNMLAGFAILIAILVALILVGYWASDLAYSVGLWPIGALLRIGTLILVVLVLFRLPGEVIRGIRLHRLSRGR